MKLKANAHELFEQKYLDRFFEGFEATDGCWVWNKAKNSEGYGYLWTGSRTRVHRMSYLLFNGEIPTSDVVCHTCDNPSCVNPEHLFLGTKGENNTDRAQKKRNRNQSGENNNMAKLTENDVITIKSSNLPRKDLATMFNVCRQSIDNIKTNKRWAHITV